MIKLNRYSENVDLAKAVSLWEHIYGLSHHFNITCVWSKFILLIQKPRNTEMYIMFGWMSSDMKAIINSLVSRNYLHIKASETTPLCF